MNTTERDEVRDYVAELRHELADLPATEVAEIIEDVTPQLTELAEAGESISARIGEPASYAAELRGAAGLSTVESTGSPLAARFAVWALAVCAVAAGYAGYLNETIVSNDARFVLPSFAALLVVSWFVIGRLGRSVPAVAELAELRLLGELRPRTGLGRDVWNYLVSLQPGWFLVRACFAGAGTLQLCRSLGWYTGMPALVALLVAGLTLVAGYRSRTDRRWLWLSVPAGGWAVGFGLNLAFGLVVVFSF